MRSQAHIVDRPRRILLIEDSQLVIEAVRDALEEDGIQVAELDDLTDLEKARALEDFDLVLLDINMPETFIDDVAVVMRRRSHLSAPIVLLSSVSEATMAARARESRLDGYIRKDRGIEALAEEIRAWLGGQRPRQAHEAQQAQGY